MKMQATSRKEARRKSAEWTGFRATTTATAMARASTAKIRKAAPAPPVSRTPPVTASPGGRGRVQARPSSLLDDGKWLDVLRRSPIGQLADVQIERLVAFIGSHLVGLGRQPDRLGYRRTGFLAKLAEHATFQIDVETVQHLHRLGRLVLLVVPVDIDDVDRALDRAERALDAALFVQPEHSPEAVRGNLLLFRILNRDLAPEEVTPCYGQAVEEIQQRQLVQPPFQGHRLTPIKRSPPLPAGPRPDDRAGQAFAAARRDPTSRRTEHRKSTTARRGRASIREWPVSPAPP